MQGGHFVKFKIYVAIMLFISAAATVTIAGILIYSGITLKDQTQSITKKVNTFTTQIDGINNNLQQINHSLQSTNSQLQKNVSSIPTSIPGL